LCGQCRSSGFDAANGGCETGHCTVLKVALETLTALSSQVAEGCGGSRLPNLSRNAARAA
jgi:hypothetical protein